MSLTIPKPFFLFLIISLISYFCTQYFGYFNTLIGLICSAVLVNTWFLFFFKRRVDANYSLLQKALKEIINLNKETLELKADLEEISSISLKLRRKNDV